MSGVTVTLVGSGSTTATTDSGGNYSFSGAQNGNYTVTPNLAGYSFSPASLTVTVNGANVAGQNFTAATSSSPTTTSLLDISNWNIGRGTAAMSNGLLTVGATQGDLIRSKQTYNQPVAFTFKGSFPDTALSYHFAGIGQAPLDANDYPTVNNYGFWTRWESQNSLFMVYPGVADPAPSISAATKSNGYFYGDYKMEWKNNAVAWYFNGSKVGEQPFASTTPVYFYIYAYDRQFKIESFSVDQSSVSTSTYSISGTVTSGGSALAGVTVTLTGNGSTTATTDSSGNYSFNSAQNGNYTVTPGISGYRFTPSSQSVTVNGTNATGNNFTATVVVPDSRFVDKGTGTIYDTVTNLTWLKDASCFGDQTWANAVSKSNSLASGQCGLTDGSIAGNWHLPVIGEIETFNNPISPYGISALLNAGFVNVANMYWSSSDYPAFGVNCVWYVGIGGGGYKSGLNKSGGTIGVWPVRVGQ